MTYPGGQVCHKLAPRGVTTRQEPEDVGGVGHSLDGQVARADDGRQVVHHQGADVAGRADVAALCRTPGVCDVLDDCLSFLGRKSDAVVASCSYLQIRVTARQGVPSVSSLAVPA